MQLKSTFLGAGALFFSALSFAQHTEEHIHSPLTCGTPDVSYEEFQAPIAVAAKIRATNKLAAANASTIYIPIKMHLFGEDDNTGFADENAVNDMIAELSRIYGKNQNIEFFFAGTSFNKYANSAMNNRGTGTSSEEERQFNLTNGATNAINLYVARSVRGTGGYSYITPTAQAYNLMYVVTGQLNDDKTTPHEMGHYFGLGHTFNQSTATDANGNPDYSNGKRELVTRLTNETSPRLSANCSVSGDYFCDTEADPYGATGSAVSNCIVTANLDANGDTFSPNMNNFMNYYWCRGNGYAFTPQQVSKMQDSYLMMNERTSFFTAPETTQSAPSNLQITSGLYAGTLELSWTDNSDVETGYIIEIAEAGTQDFTPVGGVAANTTTFKLPASVDASKQYVFRVKPSNSMKTYSTVSEAFDIPKLCAATGAKACDATSTGPEILINNFELKRGNINIIANPNSSCTGTITANYYDTYQAAVDAGETIGYRVQSKYGTNGSYYPSDVYLYCDWNQDGDFEDAGEALAQNLAIHTATGTFTIPADTPTGKYRLRALLTYTGRAITPCSTGGEIEDYALNVTNTTLSVADYSTKDNLTLYPNPASTEINLSNTKDFISYEIYDASGRLVKEGFFDGKPIQINHLNNGVYTLSAKNKQGQTTSARFIKKK